MKRLVCSTIDDCTIEMVRDDVTIVVAIHGKDVIVINPDVLIDEHPLVNYVGVCGMDTFNKVIADICRNNSCDSFFGNDPERHMKNGYPVTSKIADRVKHVALYTYSVWLAYKMREEVKQEDNGEDGTEDFPFPI